MTSKKRYTTPFIQAVRVDAGISLQSASEEFPNPGPTSVRSSTAPKASEVNPFEPNPFEQKK